MAVGSNDCCPTAGQEDDRIYESVKYYYGKVLSTSKDLKTSACTASGRPHQLVMDIIKRVPAEVVDKFYGCGAPLPLGIRGLRVLDLGSGSGRDCYVCASLVGPSGRVTGIDMTEKQLEVSRRHAAGFCKEVGYPESNMTFVQGHIEYLDKAGIEDESVDLVISNCVVNLSPDKARVLQEAYRVLAPGGEFYFSDVYCDRRLPAKVQKDEVLWGECISGALYVEDFRRLAHAAGFTDPRVLSSAPIEVHDAGMRRVLGNAKFYSITYRLFKLPDLLETLCEDYGQVATYKGTIEGHEHGYALDDHHFLETGKPMLVCGNTAAMLGEGNMSWLAPHFQVVGDRSVHYGLFDCSGSIASAQPSSPPAVCGAGSCC
ncbi:hypothetical protein WJX72_001784 [[Myrmecia] bisecta]|uniref:Arsenite methyltransferase n=1 Tax=[Myrmecia] bisecta TaxID=41462 RepID=A0AAW1PEQ9_9CHLO